MESLDLSPTQKAGKKTYSAEDDGILKPFSVQ